MEPLKDLIKELFKEPIMEPPKEHFQEPHKEPIKEFIKEPIKILLRTLISHFKVPISSFGMDSEPFCTFIIICFNPCFFIAEPT